jgi:hypothetical protein
MPTLWWSKEDRPLFMIRAGTSRLGICEADPSVSTTILVRLREPGFFVSHRVPWRELMRLPVPAAGDVAGYALGRVGRAEYEAHRRSEMMGAR